MVRVISKYNGSIIQDSLCFCMTMVQEPHLSVRALRRKSYPQSSVNLLSVSSQNSQQSKFHLWACNSVLCGDNLKTFVLQQREILWVHKNGEQSLQDQKKDQLIPNSKLTDIRIHVCQKSPERLSKFLNLIISSEVLSFISRNTKISKLSS